MGIRLELGLALFRGAIRVGVTVAIGAVRAMLRFSGCRRRTLRHRVDMVTDSAPSPR